MQETKETLPEWIDRETDAALRRYYKEKDTPRHGMRRAVAPLIEAVDAAQKRSREHEAWLLKSDGIPLAERIDREARAAYARYSIDGDHQCAVDAMRAAVAPLVEGNDVLQNRVRELEAWRTKPSSETLEARVGREARDAWARFKGQSVAFDGVHLAVAPLVEGNIMLENRVRELEAMLSSQRTKILELESENGDTVSQLAERCDYAKSLEERLAAAHEARDFEHTERDAEVSKLTEEARVRSAAFDNTLKQVIARRDEFEREATRRRAEVVKLNEALKPRVKRAEALDDKWTASTEELVAERAAHEATKAELAQAQEKLAAALDDARRWIGLHDEESRKRVGVEMSCDAHVETIGVLEAKLEDVRKAYANERAEHARTKGHVERQESTIKMARADAIAAHERADEYLATINGLLRRERERSEAQS